MIRRLSLLVVLFLAVACDAPAQTKAVKVHPSTNALIDPVAADFLAANGLGPSSSVTFGVIQGASLALEDFSGTYRLSIRASDNVLTAQRSLSFIVMDGNRIVTIPGSTTVPIASQAITISGMTAARTITVPDANWTAARIDAAQNFLGAQTITVASGFALDLTQGDNSPTGFRVTNTNAGTAATVQNRLVNDAGSFSYFGISSSGFTGYAPLTAGTAYFGGNAVPVSIFTQTSQPIVFYPNGTEAARFTPAGNLVLTGALIPATHTPSSASDTGIAGTVTWDASYIYVCTATNTWKRVAIATW